MITEQLINPLLRCVIEPLLRTHIEFAGSMVMAFGRLMCLLKPAELIYKTYEDYFKQQNDREKLMDKLLSEAREDTGFTKSDCLVLNTKMITLMQRLTRYDILFKGIYSHFRCCMSVKLTQCRATTLRRIKIRTARLILLA